MKTKKQIAKEINKMFPPSNSDYPIAFLRDDRLIVSAEATAKCIVKGRGEFEVDDIQCDCLVADYYGEFHGGYAWIDPKLETYLSGIDKFAEWENAGCLSIWDA